jgi:hypothetical protein
MGRGPNLGRIVPQTAQICMLFSCPGLPAPMAAFGQGPSLAAFELRQRP